MGRTTLHALLFGNSGQYRLFIDQGGTREAIRGHASKLDTWPHNMAMETQFQPCFCCHVSAAILWPCAQCRNVQTIPIMAYLYGLLVSYFLLLAAVEWASKLHGYIQVLKITNYMGFLGFFFISCYGPKNIQETIINRILYRINVKMWYEICKYGY